MKLIQATTKRQLRYVRKLYKSAFPRKERKPFRMLLRKSRGGVNSILVLTDDADAPLGLAVTIEQQDVVLLLYFAIDEHHRGKGAGSQALGLLQERYAGKRLLLEIESTKKPGADTAIRLRRKRFYEKNGLCTMPYTIRLFGVDMEVMTYGGAVTYAQYRALYARFLSPGAMRYIVRTDDTAQ